MDESVDESEGVDPEAMRLLGAAYETASIPINCPFCGRMWDMADAIRAFADSPEAFGRWYRETVEAPHNQQGEGLGWRGDTA